MEFEYQELESFTNKGIVVYKLEGVEFRKGLIDTLNIIKAYGWELVGEIHGKIILKRQFK